jgi:hypothetical protein
MGAGKSETAPAVASRPHAGWKARMPPALWGQARRTIPWAEPAGCVSLATRQRKLKVLADMSNHWVWFSGVFEATLGLVIFVHLSPGQFAGPCEVK